MILTTNIKISRFLEQQIEIGKVFGYQESRVPHEIQYVSEHPAVPVDEVVLLQRVQDYGDTAVEQFR